MRTIICAAALSFASIADAQTTPSPLGLRVLQNGYWDAIYTAPPPAPVAFVFFTEEQVKIRLSLASIGADAEVLLSSPDPAALFPFAATRDGASTKVEVTISDFFWRPADGRLLPVPVEPRMRLKAGESLEWHAEVTKRLPPGIYRLSFDVRATDGDGRPVIPYVADFEFEIRRSTADSRAEIARRAAVRHLGERTQDALAAAEDAIKSLSRENPNSVMAELLKADVELARGRRAAARAHYQAAFRRLEQGSDVMLLRFRQPRALEELRQAVKRMATLAR